MLAEIITIGDELLIGQVVDTNSAWIAKELNLIGIKVHQITSVSDSKEHIIKALSDAKQKASLILITGGLGPTSDDITKPTLCEFFNTHLIKDESTLDHIKQMFEKRGMKTLNERNQKQAEVPATCTVIKNPVGTAPCMWFEQDGVVFVSMPGVPFEMEEIMRTAVLPKIISHFNTPAIIHKTVQTFGIPESMLAEQIESWENALPTDLKLAYLPSPEGIRLRLSISGKDKAEMQQIVDNEVEKLKTFIPKAIFGYDNQTLQEAIGILLKEKKKTVATAESCTGGHVAKLITEISGCSQYFMGSVVAYSNKVKESVLKVNKLNIDLYGAVSQQVVVEMALGALNLFGTDYAIATSGVAGPNGGSAEKPVGTVWIAIASKDKIVSKQFSFGTLRHINIRRAASTALNMLRMELTELTE